MENFEEILGYSFQMKDDYVILKIEDTAWLDSDDFKKLNREVDVEIVKISDDSLIVHKNFLLECIRFYDYSKYIRMIENAMNPFFDIGRCSNQEKSIFGFMKSFI